MTLSLRTQYDGSVCRFAPSRSYPRCTRTKVRGTSGILWVPSHLDTRKERRPGIKSETGNGVPPTRLQSRRVPVPYHDRPASVVPPPAGRVQGSGGKSCAGTKRVSGLMVLLRPRVPPTVKDVVVSSENRTTHTRKQYKNLMSVTLIREP